MPTGRERAWDIVLNDIPLRVVRNEKGRPQWDVRQTPAIAGQAVVMAEEERRWTSFHGGFGYSHAVGAENAYHYATNLDATRPRQVSLGPLVTSITVGGSTNVSGFFEINSLLYVLAGQYCKKIDLTAHTVATVDTTGDAGGKDFDTNRVATVGLRFDANAVVFFSSAHNIQSFDGTTWTVSADTAGVYAATFWAETFYALAASYTASGDPAVRWVSQGSTVTTAANWTVTYDVGDDGKAITGVAAVDQTIFIGKTDGLYYLDRTGRTPRVIPCYQVSANNGKNLMVDSAGWVWFPSEEGLFRYNKATGEVWDVTPGRTLANESAIYGRTTALAQYRGWYYAAQYNGTDTYICVGRERQPGEAGIGPIVWHGAIVKVSAAQVGAMHVTALPTTSPRLYYGVGANAAFIELATGDPNADADYSFGASGSLYLSADDWGVPGTRWNLMSVVVEGAGLGDTTYIDVYANLDEAGYKYVGRADLSGRKFIGVSQGDDWRFSRCAFRLDFVNAASTSSPKLRAFVARAARRVMARDLISTVTHCSNQARSRYGIPTRLSGLAQLVALKQATTLGPVELVDWWTGERRERRVLVFPIQETLIQEHGNDEAEQAASVTMAVISGEENTGSSSEAPAEAAYYASSYYGTGRYS